MRDSDFFLLYVSFLALDKKYASYILCFSKATRIAFLLWWKKMAIFF